MLLYEIDNIICDNITKITDLRNMLMTCKQMHHICNNKILELENQYINKYSKFSFKMHLFDYSKEKFTIEIILDNYFHLLHDDFYNNNKIIRQMLALVGNYELFKYSYEKRIDLSYDEISYMYSCIGYGGNIDILNFMYGNHAIGMYTETIIRNAICGDKPDILDWMKTKNYDIEYAMFNNVTSNNSINIVKWMINNNITISDKIKHEIAKCDAMEILKILLYNKIELYNNFENDVLSNNSINILKYLIQNKLLSNEGKFDRIIFDRIINDNTEILQLCYDNNIVINYNRLFDYIIVNDYINVFRMILNYGYKLSQKNYENVIWHNNIRILEICIEYKTITYEEIYNMLISKYVSNVLLEWIIKYYKPKDKIIYNNHNFSDSYVRILLDNDILVFKDNYVNYLSYQKMFIKKMFNEELVKLKFHVIIDVDKIKTRFHYDDNIDNILVYIDEQCNVTKSDIVCNFNCWFYFLVIGNNKNQNVIRYCKKNICKCDIHSKYVKN